jgi:hypothetical protein
VQHDGDHQADAEIDIKVTMEDRTSEGLANPPPSGCPLLVPVLALLRKQVRSNTGKLLDD